jgi:membrane-associated phospholipid phosphatase
MANQRLDQLEYDGGAFVWTAGAVLLLSAGFAALPIDLAVAKWCLALNCPRAIHELLVNVEPFAHGIGVALILTSIFVLDNASRWALPRVVVCVAGAGIAANVLKLLVSRTRPNAFDFQSDVMATFGQWLPLTGGGSSTQSFPSAHAATAVALAIGLSWLYPRGRWLFAALAILALAQRVEIGVHFLSDAFWGAAIGWFVGRGVIDGRLTPQILDRWEQNRAARIDALSSGAVDATDASRRPNRHAA